MLAEFKNVFHRPNNAHIQLIVLNVFIFLIMVGLYVFSTIGGIEWLSQAVIKQFTIPPIFHDFIQRPWTLITYAFAHSLNDIFHILFNMLVLYWFGKIFVEHLGSDKLIALYVLGAIGGGIAYLLVFNTIPYFMANSNFVGMVGASASVFAIVAGTAVLLPNYTFFLLFLGPVKIKYIAIFYILLSFLGTVGINAGGNIAHLGGAAIGYIYIKQLQAGTDWGAWVTATINWIKTIFQNEPRIKVTYRNKSKQKQHTESNTSEDVSQAEIDSILDKVSESGYSSLTTREKEKLFKASKK